jgi:two-component system chemotaxis response regulator CheB
MPGHDIIVIGASAGGVEALKQLVSLLPADLPAAIFVVLHIPAHGKSVLPHILTRAGSLNAIHPKDGQAIRKGNIYIAPPDTHLLIKKDYVTLSRGPRENGHRPAVDPLFRSAARAYGSRVIGIVLSGNLDDGTAGLIAIKMRHGITIAQHPEDAMYTGMPMSAIENADPDYVLPADEIAALLPTLAIKPIEPPSENTHPEEMEKEVKIAEMSTSEPPSGTPATLACPECGGTLWEIQDGELIRFRCRVGHAFTAQTLLAEQSEQLEDAFWVALRALEESASLALRMADRAHLRNQPHVAAKFQEQAESARARADLVRQVLQNGILTAAIDDQDNERIDKE